jgi:hypothetical protein
MRCPKCASEVNDGVKFCNECGYEIAVKTREDQISNLISQNALRVLGWIFVPFVMIFVSWNGLRNVSKFYGTIWASIAAIYAITAIAGHNTDKQLISPVTAAVEQKTILSNEEKTAKVQADALKADDKAKTDSAAKAKKEAEVQAQKEADAKAAMHFMGEDTAVGKLEVGVHKDFLAMSVGGDFLKRTPNGEYWEFRVHVKNVDKESRTIDTNMFQLIASDSTSYDADSSATFDANEQSRFFLQKINPGIDVWGIIVFDMPKGLYAQGIDKFVLRTNSGIGFKAGSHVDFALKKR